jgi:hypothetical protein
MRESLFHLAYRFHRALKLSGGGLQRSKRANRTVQASPSRSFASCGFRSRPYGMLDVLELGSPRRAYSTCAQSSPDAVTLLIGPLNCLSQYLLFRVPATLCLPTHPFGTTDFPTLLYPEPRPTAFETERNPFKIHLPAKV